MAWHPSSLFECACRFTCLKMSIVCGKLPALIKQIWRIFQILRNYEGFGPNSYIIKAFPVWQSWSSCETRHPHRVPTSNPPSSTRGKAGKNHLTEEITPLLPTGIGEPFRQNISNLGHAALRCELPLLTNYYLHKCAVSSWWQFPKVLGCHKKLASESLDWYSVARLLMMA